MTLTIHSEATYTLPMTPARHASSSNPPLLEPGTCGLSVLVNIQASGMEEEHGMEREQSSVVMARTPYLSTFQLLTLCPTRVPKARASQLLIVTMETTKVQGILANKEGPRCQRKTKPRKGH